MIVKKRGNCPSALASRGLGRTYELPWFPSFEHDGEIVMNIIHDGILQFPQHILRIPIAPISVNKSPIEMNSADNFLTPDAMIKSLQ